MSLVRLRKAMYENGVTIEELASFLHTEAEILRELFLTEGYMFCSEARIITGIAKLCNCSMDYLFELSDVMNPVGN